MEAPKLNINLTALAANWNQLDYISGNAECAAVVKANAYGLGAEAITEHLYKIGCRTFFVAYLKEALAIHPLCPNAKIYVLNGIPTAEISKTQSLNIYPVINSTQQVEELAKKNDPLHIALHFDTGMNRLGIPHQEVEKVYEILHNAHHLKVDIVMSHLTSAEHPRKRNNKKQLNLFKEIQSLFPKAKASLANSSGIFLGKDYHFDLVRPGYALYGGNPTPEKDNPMKHVITVSSQIIQTSKIKKGESVGYNQTWKAKKDSTIATISAGYADGFLRMHSNISRVVIGSHRAYVAGQVSMDLVCIDVTDIPQSLIEEGTVTLIGGHNTLELIAEKEGTIGYEVLTRLGSRLVKNYIK